MCCNVNAKELVLPLLSQTLFKFEQGTKLRITTSDGRLFEGYAHRNTKRSRKCTVLEVANASKLGLKGKRAEQGFMRFEAGEIDKVEVLEDGKLVRVVNLHPTEVIFHTVTIGSKLDLQKLLDRLKGTGITEVGFNLHGTSVGRFGQVGWISLFMEDTLILVDALTLAKELGRSFWDLLSLHLFENEGIEKVVYNSKPIADYLYHKHCISINNVFDLQVAQFVRWCPGLEGSKTQLEYPKLSESLQKFLGDEVLPEELQLLKDFEREDFSKESPLMERPLALAMGRMEAKKACKCVAIEAKYLLRLKKVFQKLLMSKFYDCVSSQMTEIVGGNNYVSETFVRSPYRIPEDVFETIVSPGYRGLGGCGGAAPPLETGTIGTGSSPSAPSKN